MEVLIVEDNTEMATNIGAYLEAKGYTVDFDQDGVTGRHLAITNTYHAIMLDLTLRLLRRLPQKQPSTLEGIHTSRPGLAKGRLFE